MNRCFPSMVPAWKERSSERRAAFPEARAGEDNGARPGGLEAPDPPDGRHARMRSYRAAFGVSPYLLIGFLLFLLPACSTRNEAEHVRASRTEAKEKPPSAERAASRDPDHDLGPDPHGGADFSSRLGTPIPADAFPAVTPSPAPRKDDILRINGCEFRSLDGALLGMVPGLLCAWLPDGGYVASLNDQLVRMNDAGRILWRRSSRVHHSLNITPRGTILLLEDHFERYHDRMVRFDVVTELSLDGDVLFRWDTYEHLDALKTIHEPHPLLDGPPRGWDVPYSRPRPGNIFHDPYYEDQLTPALKRKLKIKNFPMDFPEEYYHLNQARMLGPNLISSRLPAFRPGNILLSDNNFSMLMILDRTSGKIVWHLATKGDHPGQHTPHLLPNGHLLMLINNNECGERYCSSIAEVDPLTGRHVWEYFGTPPESFHSLLRGTVSKAANGDYIVSISLEPGVYDFYEITPRKTIVWKWRWDVDAKAGRIPEVFTAERVSAARHAEQLHPF